MIVWYFKFFFNDIEGILFGVTLSLINDTSTGYPQTRTVVCKCDANNNKTFNSIRLGRLQLGVLFLHPFNMFNFIVLFTIFVFKKKKKTKRISSMNMILLLLTRKHKRVCQTHPPAWQRSDEVEQWEITFVRFHPPLAGPTETPFVHCIDHHQHTCSARTTTVKISYALQTLFKRISNRCSNIRIYLINGLNTQI